jgi:hypothetical protein
LSLFAPLRYFAARLRYRDDASMASYLRAGLGIEIRARKLAVHWRPHQDRSREAQRRWVGESSGGRLAVLGAGRLLDFEHALAKRFEHLRFVDADPLCQPFWKRQHPWHEPVIADVSGCLSIWASVLPRKASWAETLAVIAQQRAPVPTAAWLRDCDAILSLNLLSQIPIAWQERVEAHLHQQFGTGLIKGREEEWLAAVEPGARSLVEAHLAMLDQSGARDVLLITDLAYIDYQGQLRYSRSRFDPPPDIRGFEAEDALYGIEYPALSNYQRTDAQEWLWHISPQGLESAGKGSVHRVGSFAFRGKDLNGRTLPPEPILSPPL